MKPFDLNDDQLLWLIQGMKIAYESGNGFDSNYQLSIKTVRLPNAVKIIFEYNTGEISNKESNPENYEVKYFETYEHFNLLPTHTFLGLNDKVLECLDAITANSYDYGG
jgi:hypothetical protein